MSLELFLVIAGWAVSVIVLASFVVKLLHDMEIQKTRAEILTTAHHRLNFRIAKLEDKNTVGAHAPPS